MSKKYDDDDGRTIADMSGLDNNSVLSGLWTGLNRAGRKREKQKESGSEAARQQTQAFRSTLAGDEDSEEKETRRLYTFGALRAGLLIGLVYLAAFAALILLLLLIWGKL